MESLPPRLRRELKTIEKMIGLYCRRQHGTEGSLCPECADLLRYARNRLDHCPYQEQKPACSKCPVHCYSPRRRERIREVMRFAGPRMMLPHPILAILHQWDKRREPPPLPEETLERYRRMHRQTEPPGEPDSP